MLAVADRFSAQGLDYTAAVRVYWRVSDAEGVATVNFNARAMLDHWLVAPTPVTPRA
jgi:hypothetical protein